MSYEPSIPDTVEPHESSPHTASDYGDSGTDDEEIEGPDDHKRKRRPSIECSTVADDVTDSESEPNGRRKRVKNDPATQGENKGNPEGQETKTENSKLAKGVTRIAGKVAGNKRAKGEVKWEGGQMFFKDKNYPEWTPAVYHESLRKQFIAKDARRGTPRNTPIRGLADGDETSYEPAQQDWGPESKDWDNIVDAHGNTVMGKLEPPAGFLRGLLKPGPMKHDGLILLDMDNHPVRDIPGLNRTFSTELEDWRMEALRRIFPQSITQDFRGRMPAQRTTKGGKQFKVQGLSSFTNRTMRFRPKNEMAAWHNRRGSNKNKEKALQAKQAKSTAISTCDESSPRTPLKSASDEASEPASVTQSSAETSLNTPYFVRATTGCAPINESLPSMEEDKEMELEEGEILE